MRRPEYDAARWLAQATDDLAFARWILSEDRFFDKGCFVAQQAAEKALKAVCYLDGARTVIGHSLVELVERPAAAHPEIGALRDDARRLDRFYIPTRYPDGLPGGAPFESFVRSDLEQAVALAEGFVAAARALVKSPTE
jgi:HEPN domain-containing protein